MKKVTKYIPYASGIALGGAGFLVAYSVAKQRKAVVLIGATVFGAAIGYFGGSYAMRKLSRHPEVGQQNL